MFVQLSDEFYPLLSEHGNTIQLLADEDLTVYADPVKLARVFNNILKMQFITVIQIQKLLSAEKSTSKYCYHFSKSR